jgi:hypothetical protein
MRSEIDYSDITATIPSTEAPSYPTDLLYPFDRFADRVAFIHNEREIRAVFSLGPAAAGHDLLELAEHHPETPMPSSARHDDLARLVYTGGRCKRNSFIAYSVGCGRSQSAGRGLCELVSSALRAAGRSLSEQSSRYALLDSVPRHQSPWGHHRLKANSPDSGTAWGSALTAGTARYAIMP